MSIPLEVQSILRKQKYQLIGGRKHGAVKKCHWTHKALIEGVFCYKNWYGIQSHRCIQMTPILSCPNSCLHCWRIQRTDLAVKWDEMALGCIDEPGAIVEEALKAQRRILSGYRGNPKVDGRRYEEALKPRHFAISLAGEPTLYPYIDRLIHECHRRGFTTFLVSNGVYPEVLERIEAPSQLYISLNAPNKKVYEYFCRPILQDAWERLNKSLELLQSFSCPTCIRITLARGINMVNPEGYASMIKRAQSHYVELKGYMFLGYSRFRLKLENMPRYIEVLEFAKRISELTSYKIIRSSIDSRVILLSRIDEPIKVA